MPSTKTKKLAYLKKMNTLIHEAKSQQELHQAIVDAPFHDKLRAVELDLGIVVLLLVNAETKTIDRIALSNTELARNAVNISAKPFHSIKIPYGHKTNIISEAIRHNKIRQTSDWKFLFVPALKQDEARFNQAAAGIGCSVVSPFKTPEKQGALIFSFFQQPEKIVDIHYDFIARYRQNVEDRIRL